MLVIKSKALCHAVSLTVHSNIVNALMLVHIYWSFLAIFVLSLCF